jgi:hypothetical protein
MQYARAQVIIWPTSEKVASVALPRFVGTIIAKENNPGIRGQKWGKWRKLRQTLWCWYSKPEA